MDAAGHAAPDAATAAHSQEDAFALSRSATQLAEVAAIVARLSKHGDRLPCATATTADVHTSLQALSDDAAQAASKLRAQCQACLEGLAAVRGLSCSDEFMDELLQRIFSANSTGSAADMEVSSTSAPVLSSMTSSDAVSTTQFLDGILAASNGSGQASVEQRLDTLISALPSRPAPCDAEAAAREEHMLLRELSLDGGAQADATKCGRILRGGAVPVETGCH